MKNFSPRLAYLLGFIIISFLIGITYYLQMHEGFTPCPLCILQRFTLIVLGVIFLYGILANFSKISQISTSILAFLISLMGAMLSGRQIWLQHLPPSQSENCGASLQYLLQVLPLDQALVKIFTGSAECSQKGWEFLRLSLAEWSFIWFVFFMIFAVWQLMRAIRSQQ